MINNKKVIAIIPARGGSKRLPKKNIKKLNGKPLINWTIESALESSYIDKIVVSTDDSRIEEISQSVKKGVVVKRPKELASDVASTYDVVKYVLENQVSSVEYDYVIILQPTSPLRTTIDIDAAIKKIEENQADAIISMCENDHPIEWSCKLNKDNNLSDFINNSLNKSRTQEIEKSYRLNGAIYLLSIRRLLKEKSLFFSSSTFAYVMPRLRSYDIDDLLDFKVCESLMKFGSSE